MNNDEWAEFSAFCSRLKGDPPVYMGGSPCLYAPRKTVDRDDVRRERWNRDTQEWEAIE